MRHYQEVKNILLNANAATAGAGSPNFTSNGTPMEVVDFRHLELAVDTAGTATLTVKVQGSISRLPPDFTSAQSATNQWSYIQVKDLADASTVNGGTGIAAAGTDIHRLFEINTNALTWINVIVTAYTGGTVTAQALPVNDAN